MNEIGAPESRLIEELQNDFPLCVHPFAEIGRRCGLSEAQTLRATGQMLADGLIREISALLNGATIGFKSTLVALRVPEARIGEAAERINGHPGVSHNYQRDHSFNIWFTLSLPQEQGFHRTVADITDGEAEQTMILPALRTFKLRVRLSGRRDGGENPAVVPMQLVPTPPVPTPAEPAPLTDIERDVLARLEKPLPVEARPWRAIASDLGIDEARLFDTVGELKSRGVIRRIAAALRHRRVGFTANGMAVFRIPADRIEAAGREAAAFTQVSHCYQRKSYPEWPYTLYAMVHARSREECASVVQRISRAVLCTDYQVLYSTKEFKKQRVKYFGEIR